MNRLTLVAATLTTGLLACSLPLIDRTPRAAGVATRDATPDTVRPIVQVRDYWRASTVAVVAWDADDAAYGLRTAVTRTGELVGGRRFGDHRLYMTPLYVRDNGGFRHSFVTPGRPLLYAGVQRDVYSCFYGEECSPMVTVGVRLPDSLLRANRDSLVVTFNPGVLDPWTITLRRELIAAYLSKVDSLVAEARTVGAK